jgi:hypothetical protein
VFTGMESDPVVRTSYGRVNAAFITLW